MAAPVLMYVMGMLWIPSLPEATILAGELFTVAMGAFFVALSSIVGTTLR